MPAAAPLPSRAPAGAALILSAAWHVLLVLLDVAALRRGGHAVVDPSVTADQTPARIVWLSQAGPGGGGGGGGNRQPDPPRPAELPGNDALTVPVAARPQPEAQRPPEPVETVDIPARSMASALQALPGAIDVPALPASASQGSERDGGAGTGAGVGVGPGNGPGLGPGSGGNTGGGPRRPGNGVTSPIEIRQGVPRYTADAMRARIQGSVFVECVVQPTGTCTDIRVIRPLLPSFGLNEEAVKTAEQWRFRPGTWRGEAVPVLVTLEVQFTLR